MAWLEHVDQQSGRKYYANSETGKSQWERPRELSDADGREGTPCRDRSPPRGRGGEKRDRDRDDHDERDRRREGWRDREQRSGGKGKGPDADDWECPNCRNINWARRDTCNRCGTGRLQGPGARVASSGSWQHDQRSDDNTRPGVPQPQNSIDWPCPQCGNINWAKRNQCNICQAMKPGLQQERREGIGGGFSEVNDADRKRQDWQKQKAKSEAAQRKAEKQRCKSCKRYTCIC